MLISAILTHVAINRMKKPEATTFTGETSVDSQPQEMSRSQRGAQGTQPGEKNRVDMFLHVCIILYIIIYMFDLPLLQTDSK